MKKKIAAALAATFALGVTSAFAANPFSDVEAKHWAYDSVSKLAKAGIIDGYGDGTFRGDRTMTRYEMAQIVAKAMARSDKADAEQKAMINKLSAEFSSELNNLGVRVGALEKKVGTIKLTGDARVRYMTASTGDVNTANAFQQRVRLYMNADVNENTSFYGRVFAMNHNKMGEAGTKDRLFIADAAFTTKNIFGSEGTSATAGRYSENFMISGYWANATADGAKFTFGDKLKVTLGYADFGSNNAVKTDAGAGYLGASYYANMYYDASKATKLTAMYLKENNNSKADNDFSVWGVGFKSNIAKDWSLNSEYAENTNDKAKIVDKSPTFLMAQLMYKGASPKVAGSWGAFVDYLNMDKGANVGGLTDSIYTAADFKGWAVGFNYAVAKNIVFLAAHQNGSVKSVVAPANDKYKMTRVEFNYFF